MLAKEVTRGMTLNGRKVTHVQSCVMGGGSARTFTLADGSTVTRGANVRVDAGRPGNALPAAAVSGKRLRTETNRSMIMRGDAHLVRRHNYR